MKDRIREEIAFESEWGCYTFRATYLENAEESKGDALIEIMKDGEMVREFLFPAYKVWNIAAHAPDIVEGLERESDDGLYMAGSDLLGESAYNPK